MREADALLGTGQRFVGQRLGRLHDGLERHGAAGRRQRRDGARLEQVHGPPASTERRPAARRHVLLARPATNNQSLNQSVYTVYWVARLACWTQAQESMGSNRSRDAVG